MIEYKGVKVRELKDDNDVVQLFGFAIKWSKKQQRYTIRNVKKKYQAYDTGYFDDAVRWVIDNSPKKVKTYSMKKEILELIKIKNEVTRSDLQGLTDVIASKISPTDWQLQNEISNRILIIIDNSDNLNKEQINHHIQRLKIDIKGYRG